MAKFIEDHEEVQIWDIFDPTIPEVWNDKNQDGQWDHVEEITVMDSDFERKMQNTKVNLQFFYELSSKTEISLGHEHYYQSGYQPFDSGLNFINYTMGSVWGKLIRNNFFARVHWLIYRIRILEFDGAYLNTMRRGLTLKSQLIRQNFQTSSKPMFTEEISTNISFDECRFYSRRRFFGI